MAALISRYWAIMGVAREASSLREALEAAVPVRSALPALVPISAMVKGGSCSLSPAQGRPGTELGKGLFREQHLL